MKKLGVFLFFVSLALSAYGDSKQQIFSDLRNLYPYFTAEQIQEKITAAEDADHFLRSFSAYYFYSLKTHPRLLGNLFRLAQEGGWCVGDAHYSNFGPMLDRYGRSQFVFNDLDDAGPCPLVTDFLKFLASNLLHGKKLDLISNIQNYKNSLWYGNANYSPLILNLLDQAARQGTVINPKKLESPTKLVRDTNAREVTSAERISLFQALATAYGPGVDVLDLYATSKEGGGSHGLLRYEVLLKAGGATRLIEFTQLMNPAIYPLLIGPMPSQSDRIKTTLSLEQGNNFSHYYNVQQVLGVEMEMKPLYWGNIKVKPSNFRGDNLKVLANDEAQVLGLVHHKTASTPYITAVANTPNSDWVQAAKNVGAFFQDAFDTLKH